MRIVVFNPASDLDDPVLGFAWSWVGALSREVERVDVVSMRVGRVECPSNVRVYSLGKEKGFSEPRRVVEFYRHLSEIVRSSRIDAFFSHMAPIFSVLAAPVARALGIPIVTWYAHPSLTWKLRLAHRASSRIVTSLATAYPYKHDKVVVVGQGIDTGLFRPNGSPPESPPELLCVTRMSPVKQHRVLLAAARNLRERGIPRFRVVFIGSPATREDETYERSLHEESRALGLDRIVEFRAGMLRSELAEWYRRSTAHVNMTMTGSGDKVALEAMSAGRPCVLANEGFARTLGEYRDRLLYRWGDPDDLAEKLLGVLSSSETERETMGLYLRERVVVMHSLDGLARNLVAVFKSVSREVR